MPGRKFVPSERLYSCVIRKRRTFEVIRCNSQVAGDVNEQIFPFESISQVSEIIFPSFEINK